VTQLHETMKKLVPQIRYWLKTGFVAADKIISLHIPELYSVVRGKIGKKVEFGLSWGIRSLKGGYLLATMATNRRELVDAKFAVKAVEQHTALFGKSPHAYAYDRGGWSTSNVAALKKLGRRRIHAIHSTRKTAEERLLQLGHQLPSRLILPPTTALPSLPLAG
jgi:hypothetical protein